MRSRLIRTVCAASLAMAGNALHAQTLSGTVNRYVITGNDDAEETVSGATPIGGMDLASSDLEIMLDGSKVQYIGIRFQNIGIPQGATIDSAFIQFSTKGDKTPVLGTALIKGQDADNAAGFTSANFNISNRTQTTQSVSWPGSTSSTWGLSAANTRGPNQKTPDLKTIVQAIVNRNGWASGNSMAIVMSGAGVRNAWSYDGSATYAPQILIYYTAPVVYPANAFPIARGGTWRYFDSGSQPAANWADSSFADTTWAFGPAKLGYSDSAKTTVSFGPNAASKYTTTYFRYPFNMTNTASYDSLILRVLRDDGCVVYINGTEVFRSNMPSGTVGYGTYASSDVASAPERAYVSAAIQNSLVNGRNVIAVEIHQASDTSNDLGFDLTLLAKSNAPLAATAFPVVKLSQWNYLDDGTDQGTAWRAPGFVPSTWLRGPAKLGYEDGAVTTLYTGQTTNKYITYYFSKPFTVASVSALADTLQLNLLRDDGAVVYINGVEVVRSNMDTGALNYLTTSSTIVGNADETTYFSYRLSKSVLIDGLNTLAVEVHQRDSSSSDLGFDLELKEEGIANLLRGPYLQAATPTSMVIRWRTDAGTNSQVAYGTSPTTLISAVNDATVLTDHEVKINGLTPGTKYFYSVGSSTTMLQGDTANYFYTLPTPGTDGFYRIGVIGDCGNNSINQVAVRNQLANYLGGNYMNSWILLGDNAYSSGTDAEFQAEFFNIYKDRFLKQNPLYPTPGNHDYSNGSSARQKDHAVPYYSLFTMPTQGEAGGVPSNNKAYYSFDIGNTHFLSLDSYGWEDTSLGGTTLNSRMYDTLGAQVQWIKQDLAANTNKDWIVAYWHHPPYTMGSHNSDTEGELVLIRQNFIRILERMGVDLILTGHSHDYERSRLIKGHYGLEATYSTASHELSSSSALYNGTTNSCPYVKDSATAYTGTVYVVSGSAGQLGGQQGSFPHAALSAYSNATNGGAIMLEVRGKRLDAKWICADGVIRDQFTMMKDANRNRTFNISSGDSVTLTAAYTGDYNWLSRGDTTPSIRVAPTSTTTYVVKDDYDCVVDSFTVNVAGVPLSTSFGSVYAKAMDARSNEVLWETLSEAGTKRFIVERSLDGRIFTAISTQSAVGSAHAYRWVDVLEAPATAYYRIRQIANDGSEYLSATVSVARSTNNNSVLHVAPNPAKPREMLISLTGNERTVRLTITDATGRVVMSTTKQIGAPQGFLPADLPAGVYFLSVVAHDFTANEKIVLE